MNKTYYHGTSRSSFPLHAGLCLAESYKVAAEYADELAGETAVYAVEIDEDCLSWDRVPVSNADRDAQNWPGDRDPEALSQRLGVLAVWYEDETPMGHPHDTLRLLTTGSLDAIVSVCVVTE